ncbi:hypothetical protein [Flavobacterium sp.]|jgi:hypothetical protein|uniref:hypothetical protein n=1 Tax=Flavobacterium sp. TaxID=239 RepID=UPI003D2B5DBE
MEIQKNTLNLILSMTMNEKRHFKIFFQKINFGSQNKYLIIFDLINKYGKIDEKLIKDHLNDYEYSIKNISYDINYLNKLILRALNDFHSEKTISLKVKENLKSIEILFYKGLYDECLKLINKAKKICAKNENLSLTLELLSWEKKCSGYSFGLQAAKEVNEKVDVYIDKLVENRLITDLYYKSYLIKNSIGKTSNKKINTQIIEIIDNETIKNFNIENNSIQTQIFYKLIFANYYHVIEDSKKELLFLEQASEISNNNDYYKKENPLDYISIFIRIIDIYKKSNNNTFYDKVNELRNFENILDFQKEVSIERIFIHTNQAELDFLIFNNDIENAKIKMNDLIKKLNHNKFNIEPYHYIAIYYQFSAINLLQTEYSQSLKFINKALNEFKLNERPNTYIKSEILNIVIHFKLKNHKLVLYCFENFNKKYKKIYKLSFIEKNLLNTILKISQNPLSTNTKNEFGKLLKKIENKNNKNELVSDKVLHYFIMKNISNN